MHLSAIHPKKKSHITTSKHTTLLNVSPQAKKNTSGGKFETALSHKHRTTGSSDLSCRKLDLHAD